MYEMNNVKQRHIVYFIVYSGTPDPPECKVSNLSFHSYKYEIDVFYGQPLIRVLSGPFLGPEFWNFSGQYSPYFYILFLDFFITV